MSQQTISVNKSIFATLLLAYAVFLAGINRVPVPTVDGAVRASMARGIIENNQWYPITYEGKVVADHPPLFIWLTAMSYKIFGITDFAANLPARVAAFLVVVLTALIGLKLGLTESSAVLAAFILCTSRDFVLSSVRGYIEPLLIFFIYLGFFFTLQQKKSNQAYFSVLTGICIFLAAFSKGPPALWPFLFFALLFLLDFSKPIKKRLQILAFYFGAVSLCVGLYIWWVSKNNFWPYWNEYFQKQVLSSALTGRGGAQKFEPLFYLGVLGQYYWPWLLFLVWAFFKKTSLLLFLFGLGFVGGFSLVSWKFWYYIAPAYPAFALFICVSLKDGILRWVNHPLFVNTIIAGSFSWILLAAMLPIPLHHERVPEVIAFQKTIVNSSLSGPVWFVQSPSDHNMIGTSGEWYFKRSVIRVTDEKIWQIRDLKAPAWIITGSEYFKTCTMQWCKKSVLIQTSGQNSLVLKN